MATVGVKGLVLYLHFSDGVTVHTEYSSALMPSLSL